MKRRLSGYCFLLSVLFSVFILSANSLNAQVQFERHTIDNDLAGAYWVYAVDMDGDRDLDLVTASNRGIDWWSNSSGSFTRNPIGSFQGAWGAYAADVDLDGDMDAMGASSGVDEFAFWERTGSGFSETTLGEILGPESIHAADLDDDGDLDIIGASWSEDKILWWEHNGNGRFSQRTLDNLNNAHSVYTADLDNDGRVDGIACGVEGTRWYRNDGDGNFTDRRISTDGGWCVFAADVDGDGDNDVLRTQRNNGDVVLFRNSGGGSFSEQIIESGYGESWSVVAGDVDGDGDMDIAAAGFGANNIMVWFNNGDGSFSEGVIVDNVDTVRGVYVADLDGDGDGDIAAAIRGDRDLAWYEVKGSPAPAQTITVTAPDGSETLVAESEFTIEWESSGDIDEVDIEYSVDAGDNWTTVENSTDNDGHYNWTVPNTPTSDALIRISDADDSATRDVSDDTFEIEEPPKSIVVGLPNGGEKLFAGTEFRIEWDSTGNIDNVDIEYSEDSGGNWTTIQRDASNGGTYKWQVPSATTEEGMVRIVDSNSNSINDQSDETFAIEQPALSFTDITLSAGTGGPEIDTGGHAALFADVDSDNLPDLYFTMLFNDPMDDLFFRNTGGNSFDNEASLRGIADFDGGSHGGAFADLDNDGDFDLYNGTTFGTDDISGVNNIFQNDGNGFFVDVTSISGIPEREWPTRAALAFDMDKDGDLDLLAITNFRGSDDPPDERNEIYRNDGNMQFTAINTGELYSAPAGQGATDTDYDGDGDIDIIAANRTGEVNILQNDGSGNFTLIPPASIGINHEANDGITTGDVDNDGDLDMLLADADVANLYRNNGDGTFSFHMGFSHTDGYMGAFADLDNDTDLDLVFAGDTECYLNDGNGNFSEGPAIPVDGIDDPRAVAFADIDLDGDLDFAFGCKRSRNWLVRNNYDSGNWLKINLVSPQGQAGAFGAKTRVYPSGEAGGALLGMRESRSNNGYLGQNDPVLHFGLGSYSSVDVVVTFLDGTTITRSNVSANQTITVDLSGTAPQTPNITAFVPISGPVGTEVTVVGSNFEGVTDVSFGGVSASSFSVDSDGQIRAEVPVGAQTGRIAVTTSKGTGLSSEDFTVDSEGSVVISVFNPTDDAYVRSSRPDENNADDRKLKVRETSVDRISYLKFDVSGLPGDVQSAKLRLFVTDESGDGGSVYSVSNNYKDSGTPWTEEGLVWDNAPEIDSDPLSSLGAVPLNEVVEFDVSSAVTGNGEFSFVLENNSSDIVIYSSKEGSVAPELIVESVGSGGSTAIPIITELTPTSGVIGSEVTITGSNFIDVTNVTFNETSAATFSVDSESQIRAIVPGDAASGAISVTNSDGTGISPEAFTVIAPPEITSFTPTDGPVNTQVTIIGENFTGVTEVSFNGNSATDYTVDSDTQIRATVPDGTTSGPIHVSNEAGAATSSTSFTITAPPSTITLLPIDDTFVQSTRSDKNYGDDDELRVRESSDTDYNAYIKFNVSGIGGAPNSAVLRLHVIDDGPEGGRLHTVSNNHPDSAIPWTEESLVWDNAPPLTGSPLVTLGAVALNEVVEIDVTSVITGDGVYSLAFTNDTWDAAKYSSKEGVVAPELVIEPSGSTSPVPEITDFSPKSGGVGTEVTITGSNFADVTDVAFDGTSAADFTIESDTEIRATVPEGATTGNLTVENSEGSDSSDEEFQVISPPEITAFTPTSGPVGTKVTITGSNFTGVSNVAFNGESADDFTIFSVLEIHAIVPEAATTGKISVTNSAGTATSATEYEVTAAPSISSFTPTSGVVGTVVTLSGANFTAISSVAFNGTAASQFAVDSETSIRAEVPSGASTGPITVTNGDGTGTSAEDFVLIEPPVIDTFAPESGSVGTVVTITGSDFIAVDEVSFNGTSASDFQVDSEGQLIAEVPSGATTGKITVSNAAGVDTSNTDFTVTEISDPPPGELTFEPIEDSFVKSTDPDKNYGDNHELRVRLRNSLEIFAYIKFSVTGVGSQPENAVLRLTVTDESEEGGTVYLAENNYLGTNTPWEEEELLWDNAPAIIDDPLSSVGPVALNDVVEFDVTDAITGDGDYTFAMKSNSFDVVRYGSKDGSFTPELVISFDSGTVSAPTVTSFTPISGPVGTDVTILGDNFIGVTEVSFDGTAASTFSVESNTEIHAVVPSDASTGEIQVLNSGGSDTSDDDFVVTSTPVIASFSPEDGPVGTEVTIEGLNFSGTTEVAFNGSAASEFTIDSDTQLRATVPAEATTGAITVTNNHGTAISTEEFDITEAPTSITLVPIHDSFVRSAKPTRNYADNDELRVRQPHDDYVITYLKYDISAVGNSISSAKIRLTVLNGSEDGGSIYSVSNNYEESNTPWTEDGLLWGNAPSLNEPALSSLPGVSEGEIVEFDVTAAITGDGIYSFGILNASNDVAKYISKEGTSAPLLIIETGSSASLSKSYEDSTEISESKMTEVQAVPDKITLQQNYPNPFNIETNIEYALPHATDVRIDIYNMKGQLVRTLVDEFQTAGFKSISWDGRNSQSRVVSSGLYFIRMETGQQSFIRKITLQK